MVQIARKAMHDAAGFSERLRSQYGERILVGVAHVADERPVGCATERQKPPENLGLLGAGRVVIEVVESGFAHAHHAWAARQLVEQRPPVILDLDCVVGMDSDRREDVRLARGQAGGSFGGCQIRT